MTKVIVQAVKISLALLSALLMFSCGFGERIDGNGNVATKSRNVEGNFTSVSVSGGIEVIIVQGNHKNIQVEADDNLHEHIITEVRNGTLEIKTDANFRNVEVAKVTVQLPKITALEAAGGSRLSTKSRIKSESLEIETSSGSSLEADVEAETVICGTSSGSSLTVSGIADKLEADSSSGSNLDARKLAVKSATAEASSGSSTYVNVDEELSADASSGGNVYYRGTPGSLNTKSSSGGYVKPE